MKSSCLRDQSGQTHKLAFVERLTWIFSCISFQNKLSDLLAPISEQIQEVVTFREKNRGSKLFNHLSAVSESIQALGWVAVVSSVASVGGKGWNERGKEILLDTLGVTDHCCFFRLPSLVPMWKKWMMLPCFIQTESSRNIKMCKSSLFVRGKVQASWLLAGVALQG